MGTVVISYEWFIDGPVNRIVSSGFGIEREEIAKKTKKKMDNITRKPRRSARLVDPRYQLPAAIFIFTLTMPLWNRGRKEGYIYADVAQSNSNYLSVAIEILMRLLGGRGLN